jgi:hypothetical protein
VKHQISRIQVLKAVAMKITIFWDIPPCSPLKFNRRFGGIYSSHLLATCFHAGFLLGLFFDPEDGGDTSVDFNELHGVTFQKIVLFETTVLFEQKGIHF